MTVHELSGVIQMRIAFPLLALLAIAGPALAAKPARAPTARWIVNFDAAQCVASRNYGTSDKPLLLGLKQPALGDVMQVLVVRGGGGGRFAEQVDAKISIDGAAPVAKSMLSYASKKAKQRALLLNMPLTDFARVRAAKTLTIDAGSRLDETFALKGLEPLMNVMDQCVADLRSAWNVSHSAPSGDVKGASVSPQLAQGPIGNLQGLLSSDDYPGIAMDRMAQGTVAFALLIDEQGKVADCTITQTSGVASLDAQSCALVTQRARFKPAIGRDGKPAKSSWLQRVTWRVE